MDDASFAEYYSKLAKEGFIELPNGNAARLVKTKYGTIICLFNREIQKAEFKSFFVEFFVRMRGIPTTLDEIGKFIKLPENEMPEVIIDIENDGEIVAAAEAASDRAMHYFTGNLSEMFAETMERYLLETFTRAAAHESVEYVSKTEIETFNYVMKEHGKTMKKRMKIRKASGRKPKWTEEELRQILFSYDRILPIITEAKRFYRTIAGKRGWVKAVEALYPDLPVAVIEQFGHQGVSAGDLALSWAAAQSGKEANEYLRQKLMEVRRAKSGQVM